MKQITAVAARPGDDSGRVTRRKALHVPQPSIKAASSSSRGTLSKYGFIIQITSARLKVR